MTASILDPTPLKPVDLEVLVQLIIIQLQYSCGIPHLRGAVIGFK